MWLEWGQTCLALQRKQLSSEVRTAGNRASIRFPSRGKIKLVFPACEASLMLCLNREWSSIFHMSSVVVVQP